MPENHDFPMRKCNKFVRCLCICLRILKSQEEEWPHEWYEGKKINSGKQTHIVDSIHQTKLNDNNWAWAFAKIKSNQQKNTKKERKKVRKLNKNRNEMKTKVLKTKCCTTWCFFNNIIVCFHYLRTLVLPEAKKRANNNGQRKSGRKMKCCCTIYRLIFLFMWLTQWLAHSVCF